MDAGTVVATCAAAIALMALFVSIGQMQATRLHNRKSVRPILRFSSGYVGPDNTVGLRLENSGLGPAIVVKSEVWLDGTSLGSYSRESSDRLKDEVPTLGVQSTTIESGTVLEQRFVANLLSVDDFEWGRVDQMSFFTLVHERLRLEIRYESIYGGEGLVARFPREDPTG